MLRETLLGFYKKVCYSYITIRAFLEMLYIFLSKKRAAYVHTVSQMVSGRRL